MSGAADSTPAPLQLQRYRDLVMRVDRALRTSPCRQPFEVREWDRFASARATLADPVQVRLVGATVPVSRQEQWQRTRQWQRTTFVNNEDLRDMFQQTEERNAANSSDVPRGINGKTVLGLTRDAGLVRYNATAINA